MNRFEMYMDGNALFLKLHKGDKTPRTCAWGDKGEDDDKYEYTGEMNAYYILRNLSKSESLVSRDIARYLMDYGYKSFKKYINFITSNDNYITRDIIYVKPYDGEEYTCSVIFESLATSINVYLRLGHKSNNDYSDIRVSWIPKPSVSHIYANVNKTIEEDINTNMKEFAAAVTNKIYKNIYHMVGLDFVKDLAKFITDKFNKFDVINLEEGNNIIIKFHDDIENYKKGE